MLWFFLSFFKINGGGQKKEDEGGEERKGTWRKAQEGGRKTEGESKAERRKTAFGRISETVESPARRFGVWGPEGKMCRKRPVMYWLAGHL